MLNILILCTHNSARSALGEAMFNHWARALNIAAKAYSAGSAPSGRINPHALTVLQAAGIDTSALTSKNWDVFTEAHAPEIDLVITVCDSAAGEMCPLFLGNSQQLKIHWGYPDPSLATGDDTAKNIAFELTRQAIGYRILMLLHCFATLCSNASNGEAFKAAWRALPKEVRTAQLAQVLAK